MIELQVLGSSGDVYRVGIEAKEGGKVAVTCSCRAGQSNTMCKHRGAVIGGDGSVLEKDQEELWNKARKIVEASTIAAKLAQYERNLENNKMAQNSILKRIENELAPLKEEAKQIKKSFAATLDRGM